MKKNSQQKKVHRTNEGDSSGGKQMKLFDFISRKSEEKLQKEGKTHSNNQYNSQGWTSKINNKSNSHRDKGLLK